MNILKKTLAVCSLLALTPFSHASAIYDFSTTLSGGTLITGSFTGDASGNIIQNLSNISVSANGIALSGSGSLFSAHVVSGTNYQSGGAVVSFDGHDNNFLFIDSNYPSDLGFTNFFGDITAARTLINGTPSTERALYYPAVINPPDTFIVSGYDSTFLVVQRDVSSIPEPTSIALLGLGLLGLVSFRRRSKAC